MADDSYDEELLLENSPLSQYLREVCPDQDFETIHAVGDKRAQARTNGNHCDNGLLQLQVVKDIAHWSFEWIFPPVSKFIIDWNAEFLPQYASLALDSRLLLDTDRQMIQAYCPKRIQDTRLRSSSHQRRMVWMCGHILCALAVLCATLGIIFPSLFADPAARYRQLSSVHLTFCFIALLSSTSYAIHWTRACWILNSLRRLHKKNIECTGQCLLLLDRQGRLLTRSIRYIQEVEVISRGFTMVSQYTPIVRLENAASSKHHRQCIVLRRTCFYTARAQFTALRDATLCIMKQHPLAADIDHVSNYLAMIDIDDLAPWIKVAEGEEVSQDSLSELTGSYSLAALKAMNSLFLEQRSEFIRRLVLCTCPDARLQHEITVDALSSWFRIVHDVSASCESSLEKLKRSYDCHRQRPGHNKDNTPSGRFPRGGDEIQPRHRLNIAVHSLRLHLEATLNRVVSVEETLEGSDEDRRQASRDDSMNAVTSEMLDTVKRELTASQDCLQEALSSLEKMNSKERNYKQYKQDGGSGVQQSDIRTDSREPILLLPIRDTEIEFDDQVFEAYTDTEPWERCEEEWGEGISDQERLRRRREAEETKRMLQELHSVLSVRKAERERMKSERNTQKAKSDVYSTNKTRNEDKVASHGLGTEDRWTRNGISEDKGSAIGTVLASKELDSCSVLSNSEMCDFKDDKTRDASASFVRVTEDNTNDISSKNVDESDSLIKDSPSVMAASDSHICDAEDRVLVDLTRDVDENVSLTSNESESLVSARGLSTTCIKTRVSAVEPEASSVCVGTGERYSQETNLAVGHVPGCIVTTSLEQTTSDDLGHLVKNQSTDGPSDSAAAIEVGSQYFPTEGQMRFFLPSLAAEAARKSRQCQQEEEIFIGSDEDNEDSE